MATSSSDGGVIRLPQSEVDKDTVGYDDEPTAIGAIPRPTKLGRYTVLEMLGVGGMGFVCTAYDPKLDRKVAIKLLRERYRDDRRSTTGQARLVREAQALAQLAHPNVVTVHDVDTQDDQLYMAMEYVDGKSIEQWMKEARPWREVVDVFVHAARGLAAAHEAGITHRDFKPSNVLISHGGRVVVVDFGLAKSESRPEAERQAPVLVDDDGVMGVIGSTHDAKLTQAGRTVGTPAYMAPEQFVGIGADAKTDQYSFGVSLFEALYGDLPYPDATADDLIEMAQAGTVVEQPDSMVPGWLFRVVQRTLQPRPEDRYASMHEVIAALQADPARRRRRIILGATGTVLAGLGSVVLYMQGGAAAKEEVLCTGAEERMASVWSPEHQQRVHDAFVATGKPFAEYASKGVSAELDRYRGRWEELHTEICEATNLRHEQSPALMDARMSCLERGRQELGALVDLLVAADGRVVLKASDAAQDLFDIESCASIERDDARLPGPEIAAEVEAVESKLAHARVLDRTGKLEEALAIADEALADAERVGHPPLVAQAQYLAALQRSKGSLPKLAVYDDFLEAALLAQRTQQPELAVRAWTQLMLLEAGPLGRPAAGLALRAPAQVAVDLAGDDESRDELARATGLVHWRAHDFEAALEHLDQARRGLEQRLGPRNHHVAVQWLNLSATYGNLGRYDEAHRAIDNAIGILEETAGPDHPVLASALLNRGSVLITKGDHEGALQTYDDALRILEKVRPPSHGQILKTRTARGQALLGLERLDEAQAELEAVVPLYAQGAQGDLFAWSQAHTILGDVFAARAARAPGPAADQAREHYLRAMEVLERREDESSRPMIANVHQLLCRLELEHGRTEDARSHCEATWSFALEQPEAAEALIDATQQLVAVHRARGALSQATTVLEDALAELDEAHRGKAHQDEAAVLRLALADLLWQRSMPEAARAEARRARESLPPSESSSRRDELDAWLRDHP